MKKTLLTLAAVSFPIVANATPSKTIPDATVKSAIELFKPAFCKGPRAATEAIQSCYENTKSTDPKIDRCILADLTIFSSISNGNEKREALGKPPLLKDITFLNEDAFQERYTKYMKPRLQQVNNKPMFAYYKAGGPIFSKAVISNCPSKE